MTLRVTEIYRTIEGEAGGAGRPATFVRLTGCPLRCVWCDAPHAFQGGEEMSVGRITAEVSRLGMDLVTVTGGEPLAQEETPLLCATLARAGAEVRLETSGSYDVRAVPPPVRRIVDLKAPGSGEEARNRWDNLEALVDGDEVKVVVASRADFDWAVAALTHVPLPPSARWIQPAHGTADPRDLARWILEAAAPVRLSLQVNKIVGLP